MLRKPRVEVLESRDCPSCTLPGNMQSAIDNPSAVIQHNAGAMAGNNQPGNATEQAWTAANSLNGQTPLFYMLVNGVLQPQFDYSNMDPAVMAGFTQTFSDPAIAQALTPAANYGPFPGLVNDPPPASQDFAPADQTIPYGFTAPIPQDGTDALAASVAGFLSSQKH